MASVSSEALAGYWPLFEYHARRLQGIGGAEFDDLVQEGAFSAWIAMEYGFYPSDDLIVRGMLDWIRFVSHRGLVYEYTEPLAE
jgi:hypothetical protein